MFQKHEHRVAGHAAAAKSRKTPVHLRHHQQRLSTVKPPGNMPRSQTVPLHKPGSSLQQPVVSTPVVKTKVRFYQKPKPLVKPSAMAGVSGAPKNPVQTGRGNLAPFGFQGKAVGKPDWSAPKSPSKLGRNKKLAAIYGG
jgi:hypothetical protein